MGKIYNRIVKGFCKCLQEGTAAAGAGLVKLYGINCAILNADALHVLSADIQYAVHLRIKE